MSLIPSEPLARSTNPRWAVRVALDVGPRLIALAIVFNLFGVLVGGSFYTPNNIENILMQSAVYAMAGLGMTMVLIIGGVDLAAGSVIALAMVVPALTLVEASKPPLQEYHFFWDYFTAAWWVVLVRDWLPHFGGTTLKEQPAFWTAYAVVAGVVAGALAGLVQGLLITSLRLVPFIVTLGGLQAIRGLAKGIAHNSDVYPPDDNWLAAHLMLPVQNLEFSWRLFPLGVWATIVAAILAAALLRYTKFGRRVFAVGSNEATARLCGVPVARTKVFVYALSGLFAGLAGVLEFSKLNIGQTTGGISYELYVIAACVIGGTSLRGGVGSIFGTIVGALIIGVMYAGAQQAGWEKWVQESAIGLIIIAAVALDQLRMRRRV